MIEPVKQRLNGCFPAVIAMLTGIDYDLLPDVTVALDTRTLRFVTGRQLLNMPVEFMRPPFAYPVGWGTMRHYMRFNYGVKMSFTHRKPKVPAGRLLGNQYGSGGHIVVEMPDGYVIDPNKPGLVQASIGAALPDYLGMRALNLWVTATLL